MPVDFRAILNATSTCWDYPRLEPFFNYYNTSHAEGPKKWYISACPEDVMKVYLPAKGALYERAIQAFGSEEGIDGHVNGEKVLINVQVRVDVSPDITVFYQHLTLRDEIIAMVQDFPNRVVLEAGTHIGYGSPGVNFGVRDRSIDAGLTPDPSDRWNSMVNPLDYFVDDVRESILEDYQATYETLLEDGTFPYSDIEDSRLNINEQDTIWGFWFKDDLPDMWDGSAWSVVTLMKKADLHQATYWKTLEEFPTMSGLFVEQSGAEVVGKPLYDGQLFRRSKFHILSGNERVGVARIGADRGKNPRTIYLKYELQPNTASEFDDKLIMESFSTLDEAAASEFSDKAVLFRRNPCKNSNPACY